MSQPEQFCNRLVAARRVLSPCAGLRRGDLTCSTLGKSARRVPALRCADATGRDCVGEGQRCRGPRVAAAAAGERASGRHRRREEVIVGE